MDSGKIVHQTNPEIPAINLTATHKMKHLNDEVSPKRLDLIKVIRLLEDPLTTNLTERHLLVLKKLLRRNQAGFLLRQLADLSHILNICAEKASDRPRYASVLCGALEICRFPFLKERASDELIYAQDVVDFLSNMGRLMRVPHAEVQERLLQTVKSFFSSDAPTDLPEDLQPTSPVYRLQLLERSDLPRTLLLSMAALQNRASTKLQLLQTIQLLSGSSDLNCASILEAGGAETVCLHMNEAERCGRALLCSSQILWNLLQSGGRQEALAQLSSMECAASLREAFPFEPEATSHASDLQLRNHLLVVTTLMAENPACPLVESLFAKQLLGFITFPEATGSSAQKLFHSSEELKTRKLLLNLLVVMCRNVAALQLFREELVMVNLLQLVSPLVASPEQLPGSPGCLPPQQEELQLQALDALAGIAPVMLHDYMSCQGNTYLLLLLDWCIHTDARVRVSRTAQTQRCIRVLRSVTALGEPAVNQDLCDQGAIHQLLGVLVLMEASCDEDDVVAMEVMTSIQLILSALCETDLHKKELFGPEGVEMVVHFLKNGSEKFYSGLGHNKLVISTVDCVWSCIVGCSVTEGHFLAREGASLLLDLLAATPSCVRGVILATLLDLCSNPESRPQILGWRDAGGQSAAGVLLPLWREEEEELGVLRNRHGGITDPKKPLLSRLQEESSSLSFAANAPSAAVLETSENLRAKIYLLLCSLGFQELPGLSAGDYVTLSIVRRYLDFKVAEVWREISRELILDGVKPISSDKEALRSICESSEETARRTMEEQARILEEQQQEEIREEMLVYAEMKTQRTQQQLAAKSWDRFVSRTSNYSILKEEKAQRMKYMESELKHEAPADRPAKRFISHILAVENTGDPGPAGINVTLARTSV
uniref:Cilia and flagella associated protein 69 n=1 Tax=Fundulus heteroclitus TaxID=8078 RepID=A0A3Q2PJ34_FUNHE